MRASFSFKKDFSRKLQPVLREKSIQLTRKHNETQINIHFCLYVFLDRVPQQYHNSKLVDCIEQGIVRLVITAIT